jgi:hypothetical protein
MRMFVQISFAGLLNTVLLKLGFLMNSPRTRGLFTVGVGVPGKDDVQLNKVLLCEVVGCLEKAS